MTNDFFQPTSPSNTGDPFSQPIATAAPPRSSNTLAWGCGIASVLVLLLCCGGGAFVVYGLGEVMSAEIETELGNHPVIEEYIGNVEDLSMDFAKSAEIEGEDVYVYDIQGDRGSGELIVESITNDAGMEEIITASLRLPDGETIELNLDP